MPYHPQHRGLRQLILLGVLVLYVLFTSVPVLRALLTSPLVVSDSAAAGDAAYVLAAGSAFWERLEAVTDLYHEGRVPLIIIMRDDSLDRYNFKDRSSWTPTLMALDFLRWRGIPAQDVLTLEFPKKSYFGTLAEARSLAAILPPQVKRLVLVTSPAHTRRSLLAFKQSMPAHVVLLPYAATSIGNSVEFYSPLWLEYFKLLVYAIIA